MVQLADLSIRAGHTRLARLEEGAAHTGSLSPFEQSMARRLEPGESLQGRADHYSPGGAAPVAALHPGRLKRSTRRFESGVSRCYCRCGKEAGLEGARSRGERLV